MLGNKINDTSQRLPLLVNTKLTQTELIMLRFLLDFKREFSYPRVYRLWETIWAAGNDRLFAMRVEASLY